MILARALFASMCLILASCSAPGLFSSPLRLGAIYPVTGPEAAGGREEWNGVQLAAQFANVQGGWHGRRIEFVLRDTPSPEAAAEAARSLVDGEHLPVVVGAHGSSIALEAARAVLDRGSIYWETGAVASDLLGWRHPHFFRTGVDGRMLGAASARFTAEVLAQKFQARPADLRVGVVHVDDVYGRSVAAGAVTEATRQGLPVVASIAYDPHEPDVDQLVTKIERSAPDVLFVASYLQDGVAIRRATLRRHLPLRAMVGTSSAFCLPAFGDILGPDAVGLYASDKPGEDIKRQALRPDAARLLDRMRRAYRARFGAPPGAAALAGFVSAWVLLHEVLPRVSHLDPDQLAAAARNLDLPEGSEITGAGVRFASADAPDAGQNRRPASIVWEWQAPRQIVPVFPPAYALKDAILLPISG